MAKTKLEPVDPRDVEALMAQYDIESGKKWSPNQSHRDAEDKLREQAVKYAADEGARGRFFDTLAAAMGRELFLFAWVYKHGETRYQKTQIEPPPPLETPPNVIYLATNTLVDTEFTYGLPMAHLYLLARAALVLRRKRRAVYSVQDFATWLAARSANRAADFEDYFPGRGFYVASTHLIL